MIGLLFAQKPGPDNGEPQAVSMAGGTTLIERQCRQLARAGCSRILVLADQLTPGLTAALDCARADGLALAIVRDAAALAAQMHPESSMLLLGEAMLLDERLVETLAAATAPAVLVWTDGSAPATAERLDAQSFSGGAALLPAALARDVLQSLGDWDAEATLLRRAASDAGCTRIAIDTLETYAASRRRQVPFVWSHVTSAAAGAAATDALLAAAQKGCLDWPARFVHPPIENWLTRQLLPTPVTPNQVSLLVFLLGLGAVAAFAAGWLWVGLALVLLVGPLDGVDGKLARTRMQFSKWGDLEHVGDKVTEYLLYVALAWHFGAAWAWCLAAMIIAFALAEAVQGEFFRRFTGRQLDDWGPVERRFRLVSGRRNTFFWSLVPFALFGAWEAGFVMIAAYAVLTFFFMQWRFFAAMAEYGKQQSAAVAANFAATAYAFLPSPGASAR